MRSEIKVKTGIFPGFFHNTPDSSTRSIYLIQLFLIYITLKNAKRLWKYYIFKAHQANDRSVMQAYGMPIGETDESACVAWLMRLYQEKVGELEK